MALQAGVAKVNITPPIGCTMGGYAARTHGSEGVHDDLWARALYLSDGKTEVALVTVELLGIPVVTTETVRREAEVVAGIPHVNIMLTGTHTHSGPAVRPGCGAINERYMASLPDHIVGAIAWAKRNSCSETCLHYYRAPVQCGVNRRAWRNGRMTIGVNPQGPVYSYVDIISISGPRGETIATWFSHACHAIVLGPRNYHISGDFPGAACRQVEAVTGAPAMFANGCTGDINAVFPSSGFAEVEKLGQRLSMAVIAALTGDPLYSSDSFILNGKEAVARLPLASGAAGSPCPGQAEVGPAAMEMRIGIITLGNIAIAGLPAEVFVELGQAIQRRSPFAPTIVTGYTNGYMGYVPTKAAFAEGGYEVVDACVKHNGIPIASDAGDVLVDTCVDALQS